MSIVWRRRKQKVAVWIGEADFLAGSPLWAGYCKEWFLRISRRWSGVFERGLVRRDRTHVDRLATVQAKSCRMDRRSWFSGQVSSVIPDREQDTLWSVFWGYLGDGAVFSSADWCAETAHMPTVWRRCKQKVAVWIGEADFLAGSPL
jgi:hypothetical protein